MTFQKSIVTTIATGALLLGTLSPMAFADTSISGNGAVSTNTVTTTNNSSTSLNQNNSANITNTVNTSTSTGGNHADFNTGGGSMINTGSANNSTNITTNANANVANFANCNCTNGTGTIGITGNGAFSDNTVSASNTGSETRVSQNNDANIRNTVDSKTSTGDNSGNFNTGGTTTIVTGDASSNTSISNNANANIATLGGTGTNGALGSAVIADNGAESDNAIALGNESTTRLTQDNVATIVNDVRSNAQTGHNHADFNTGGDTIIATGNANNSVGIDNRANINFADMNACGCMGAGMGTDTIFGNGAFSENTITDRFGNELSNTQHNVARVSNDVENSHGNGTGNNSMTFGTSDNGEPSFLFTGNSQNTTNLNTSANMNSAENGVGVNLGGMDLSLFFDLNSILNQLHM